jgi:hypothetical protein
VFTVDGGKWGYVKQEMFLYDSPIKASEYHHGDGTDGQTM